MSLLPTPIVISLTLISSLNVVVALNVFAPAKVCDPVVTTPPLVASAGVKINSVVPLIVAPLALEVPDIDPIELKPALAAVIEDFT